MKTVSKQKQSLVIVAHPDDETLFFGGLLQRKRRWPWRVVCVTDGNADGQGAKRLGDFAKAMSRLKVRDFHFLNFPDQFHSRLNVQELMAFLGDLEGVAEVFTHGPLGEYGHPHHQDVSFAVHNAFNARQTPIYSVAYNCTADFNVNLTSREFQIKSQILAEIYFSETERFVHMLPATATEGFTQVTRAEVNHLYQYWTTGSVPSEVSLKKFKWLHPYLKTLRTNLMERPF